MPSKFLLQGYYGETKCFPLNKWCIDQNNILLLLMICGIHAFLDLEKMKEINRTMTTPAPETQRTQHSAARWPLSSLVYLLSSNVCHFSSVLRCPPSAAHCLRSSIICSPSSVLRPLPSVRCPLPPGQMRRKIMSGVAQ